MGVIAAPVSGYEKAYGIYLKIEGLIFLTIAPLGYSVKLGLGASLQGSLDLRIVAASPTASP